MLGCDEAPATAQTRACTGAGRASCHGPGQRRKSLKIRGKASNIGCDAATLSRTGFEREFMRMTRELLRFASQEVA